MAPITDSQAIASQAIPLPELYEIDDHLWLEQTIELLKAGNFAALDLENLIEELESLANRDRHRVESFLEQIIRHLLMLQYWDSELERNSAHWQAELFNFRTQLDRYLTTNLRNHLESQLSKTYAMAMEYVFLKSARTIQSIPNTCPYTLEQLLDRHYL